MQDKADSSRPPQPARFGIFEVDFARGEVRKHGLRIKLQEKPFQILMALLEQPGEIVTREELRAKVWGPSTFVDFERSLNIAINKLRAVLGDEPQNPRFIETVPRRGYRFIAPFTIAPSITATAQPTPIAVPLPTFPDGQPHAGSSTNPATTVSIASSGLLRSRALAATATVAILLGVGEWISRPHAAPQVLDFVQLTADGEGKGGPLLTDGVNLFFESTTLGMKQVSIKGGQTAPLRPDLGPIALHDYSPKRGTLLVTEGVGTVEESQLWEVPLPAGSPRPLGGLRGYHAKWSPDGERVAICVRSHLKVAKSDGSGEKDLGEFSGDVRYPQWSPDGKRIRFIVRDDTKGLDALWEVADDGSNRRLLVDRGGFYEGDLQGNWLGDGRSFVFSLSHEGRSDLWLLREESGWLGSPRMRRLRLTDGQINMLCPVPSADNQRLYVIGRHDRNELVRYDPRSRQFLPYLQGISADELSFSRDAQWVAYILFPEHTLWRSRVDGSERRQLTFAPVEAFLPSWSPDGKTIAVMARTLGKPWKISRISSAGGALETILPGEESEGHAAWSPDGATLIFAGVPWEQAFAPGSTAIQQLDLQTLKVTRVRGSEDLWSPRWSPDGRYLVAETLDSRSLMLFDFAGKKWKLLTELRDSLVGYTSWSRDSKWVYFNSAANEERAIYRVAVPDGRAERFLDLSGIRQPDTLGQWFALAPDGAPLILRYSSLQEIYSMTLHLR
jgi:Tol biopolymer transport system component/DNA-binding winged helix-turn-helix (wHTH) protein